MLQEHTLVEHPIARVRLDTVRRPDNTTGPYLSVQTADLVRILVVHRGHVLIAEQHHYLTGPGWQLPGGRVEPTDGGIPGLGADSDIAAARELREETGLIAEKLIRLAVWEPLPGLTASRTHVFRAAGALTVGATDRDDTEADLALHWIPQADAIAATLDGRVRCAPSAAAILTLGRRPQRRSRWRRGW